MHLSINAQLQVMLKGKMGVAKRSFFFLFGIIAYMYTEQSQDKLKKMKAGIHKEVLTGRAFFFHK